MSNFAFIQAEWPDLFDVCQRAESYVVSDPNAAIFTARVGVERVVNYLFADVFGLPDGYRSDLNARMNDPEFKNRTSIINSQLNLIRRRGNDAAHSTRLLTQQESLATLRGLFDIVVWTVKNHTPFPAASPLGRSFDESIAQRRAPLGPAEVRKLAERFAEQQENAARAVAQRDETIAEQAEQLAQRDVEIALLRENIAAARAADTVADTHDYRESEARDELIDLLIQDAGWDLTGQNDREYPVEGLPVFAGGNVSGRGFVDYVLWGKDGKPLGLVEAKRTSLDPSVGGPQAKLYADALERAFGQRPVIFLSNGYRHQIWDDAAGYPPRAVAGFYTRSELELIVWRRGTKRPLTGAVVDSEIAGRPYQLRAIAKVGEHFDAHQRRALLVMATGTGKTRTTIALAKLMMTHGWAKRVLFLADRTALVTQAQKAFSQALPEVATVNLTADKVSEGRVYLSTYPTMLNLVDNARDGAARRFGPGYFDLIVVDEAHRSVYQKYGTLFEWFDGHLLGLTATPIDDIARSTYRLFELEPGVPTDSYPLDQAIADGYLVGPENLVYDYGFHREGIRYDDLTAEEQESWDETEWNETDPEDIPTEVAASSVFRSLFNVDTADKALAELMSRGYRVAGGDRLGKTIVFAMNQRHAAFLKERFDAQYPHLGGEFAQVITSQSPYAQQLIDDFSQTEKAPHIALSVDMLDTGIDVPEVLNLVLFKQVFSKTKFWQMIGRGTRLARGVFGGAGESDDKRGFKVFDFCGNVEYFAQEPVDQAATVQPSLTHRLFTVRARLVNRLDDAAAGDPVRASAVAWLSEFVAGIPRNSFLARPHGERIARYSSGDGWSEPISAVEAEDVAHSLGALPSSSAVGQEHAKRFDLLMLTYELALLDGDVLAANRSRQVMAEVASLLLEKQTIPQVVAALDLLQEMTTASWWDGAALTSLEQARNTVRSLVQFLDKRARRVIVVDWEDDLREARSLELPLAAVGVDQARFKEKVSAYIREHQDHLAIQRLRRNLPLTQSDLDELGRILVERGEGTPEALARVSGERGLGVFVRSLVGMDREAAEAAFAERLSFGGLNSTQMEFLRHVIDELTRRGEMQPARLYQPPYSESSALQIDTVFPVRAEVMLVVDTLTEIENSARPAA
ncbi:type I restriction enzyme R subunit [Mycolicibacterium mucogenicum 261Sha1.1M5]|nr:type I restriction enzyme R subunit [Mycolicibacterium mucogenicum 261Sha1.1M5]